MIEKVKTNIIGFLDGAKQISNNAIANISDKINAYSGKDVTQKVEEFTEVFSDILIGMDKELTALKSEIKRLKDKNPSPTEGNSLKAFLAVSSVINLLLLLLLVFNYAL